MQAKRTSPRPPVLSTCLGCGSEFLVWPNRLEMGKGKFCGVVCQRAARRVPVDRRFWGKVDQSGGPDACWIWLATKSPDGYGAVRASGKMQKAHRIAWELTNGPIPSGLCVCHNCPEGDNPSCVNPAHLFLDTVERNNRDRATKGRSANTTGARNPFARLNEQDVAAIKQLLAEGSSQQSIAARFAVNQSTISLISRGKTWKHVGPHNDAP